VGFFDEFGPCAYPGGEQRRYVYVVEGGGSCKVGTTAAPNQRVAQLQVGSPVRLTLRAVVACSCSSATDLERRVHERLAAYRTHGEWFRIDVASAIAALLREGAAVETPCW
jgi:hypothetical protein